MKNKIKIFIALGITLITTLIFTISTFASTGYNITNNGNIESLNLANLNNFNNNNINTTRIYEFTVESQVLKLSNLDSSDNDPYIYFNNFITLKPNTTYSYYYISNNQPQSMMLTYNNSTNLYATIYDIKQTFTTNSNDLSFGFGFEGIQGLNYEIKLMIYEGNNNIDYFPYGNYYDNKYTSLYQAFNNANVKLYNLTNNNLILQENINITNSNVYNLQNDTINIANYLNNEEGNNRYYYIIIELNQAINNTLILNTYNDTIEANAKIYSYNEIYSQSYIRQENKDYIQIEATNYYNYIYYDGFYTPDYTKLEISLNIDSINYSRGYNTGYDEGYESGYIEGKASGRTEGKINANSQIDTTSASYIYGYEQGQASNNSLQGMVISIAETPINIFKQIFNFNILGFDITQFLFSLVSLLLVIFLIKKIIK